MGLFKAELEKGDLRRVSKDGIIIDTISKLDAESQAEFYDAVAAGLGASEVTELFKRVLGMDVKRATIYSALRRYQEKHGITGGDA